MSSRRFIGVRVTTSSEFEWFHINRKYFNWIIVFPHRTPRSTCNSSAFDDFGAVLRVFSWPHFATRIQACCELLWIRPISRAFRRISFVRSVLPCEVMWALMGWSGSYQISWVAYLAEAKQGQSNTMTIDSNAMGRRPRPPFGVNHIGICGHGVGLSLFGLGGPIN